MFDNNVLQIKYIIITHTFFIFAKNIKANAPVLAAPKASFYQSFLARHAPKTPPPITPASTIP